MKRVRWLVLFGVFLLACAAQGQGFRNLGFEAATIVPVSGDAYQRIEFSSALRWWTGSVGGEQQDRAIYNDLFLDSAGIGLVTADSLSGVIAGDYTAVLQAGLSLATRMPADATLSQVGQVPIDAQSLRFSARSYLGFFTVALGGEVLPLQKLGDTAGYSVYAADVKAWAGQVAQLSFTAVAQDPHVDTTLLFLDSISFSAAPVPEPGCVALLTAGSAVLFLILRRSRR